MLQIINPISKKFINEADILLEAVKKLHTKQKLLEIFKTLNKAEESLRCALYTGNDYAYHKLAELYNSKLKLFPGYKEFDSINKELHDVMVLAGKKLGVKECLEMKLMSNSQNLTETYINNIVNATRDVQEYFSDDRIDNDKQTKIEFIDYYNQTFKEISNTDYNTGNIFFENFKKPVKPTVTFTKDNKLHEVYCDAENDVSITIIHDTQDNNKEADLVGDLNVSHIINHFLVSKIVLNMKKKEHTA